MSDGNFIPRTAQLPSAAAEGAAVTGGPVRAPRIVLIDDEPIISELMELLLRPLFNEVIILTFQNRDTAWQELMRASPDLLITDMNNQNVPGRTEYLGMSGWELLPLLTKRAVKYPILVVSGSFSLPGVESQARARAGPGLNISFMTKPFTVEFFQQEVSRMLRGGHECGRRFPKAKL